MDWKIIMFCVSILLLISLLILMFYFKGKMITNQLSKANKGARLFYPQKNNNIRNKKIPVNTVSKIILNSAQGYELALKRTEAIAITDKKYSEICTKGSLAFANLVQGAMPTLSQARTLNEIAKAAPNGLFTATAPITELMKYKDGTVGSILMRKGKGFVAHSGFQEIALNVSNPAAVIGAGMQAMAAVSGQYYMHKITSQLKNIDRKLDKLVEFHHDEKIGILKCINKELIERTSKINVDAADIIAVQRQKEKAEEIYFEYSTRLESIDDNDIIEVKKRWVNKTKEIQNLNENLDKKELEFTIYMCYHASVLVEKCLLTEISIRMKIGGQELAIEELCGRLKSEYSDRFHRRAEQIIREKYTPILDKAASISRETEKMQNSPHIVVALDIPTLITSVLFKNMKDTMFTKQAEYNTKEIENLELRRNELLEITTSNSQIVEEVISLIENPKEILYLPSEKIGEERIFVEEVSESSEVLLSI